jgi:hypothetical protein
MEIDIGEIVSTVHAVDGDSVLSPRTLEKIVRVVLEAVNAQEEHRERVRSEQRITGGVREELEEDWR